MYHIIISVLLIVLLMPRTCLAGVSVTDEAEEWLSAKLDLSGNLSLSLSKNKIKFDGCRQKDYRLSIATHLSNTVDVEAVAFYGRGILEFGVFNQRVTSKAYEVITWWQQPDYRMGLATQFRPAHDLELPISGTLALPESSTLSVYLEREGFDEAHTVSFAVRRETWKADGADIDTSWRRSYDNQLHLGYRIEF